MPRHDAVVAPLTDPKAGFSSARVHVSNVSRAAWLTNLPVTETMRPEFDLGTL